MYSCTICLDNTKQSFSLYCGTGGNNTLIPIPMTAGHCCPNIAAGGCKLRKYYRFIPEHICYQNVVGTHSCHLCFLQFLQPLSTSFVVQFLKYFHFAQHWLLLPTFSQLFVLLLLALFVWGGRGWSGRFERCLVPERGLQSHRRGLRFGRGRSLLAAGWLAAPSTWTAVMGIVVRPGRLFCVGMNVSFGLSKNTIRCNEME